MREPAGCTPRPNALDKAAMAIIVNGVGFSVFAGMADNAEGGNEDQPPPKCIGLVVLQLDREYARDNGAALQRLTEELGSDRAGWRSRRNWRGSFDPTTGRSDVPDDDFPIVFLWPRSADLSMAVSLKLEGAERTIAFDTIEACLADPRKGTARGHGFPSLSLAPPPSLLLRPARLTRGWNSAPCRPRAVCAPVQHTKAIAAAVPMGLARREGGGASAAAGGAAQARSSSSASQEVSLVDLKREFQGLASKAGQATLSDIIPEEETRQAVLVQFQTRALVRVAIFVSGSGPSTPHTPFLGRCVRQDDCAAIQEHVPRKALLHAMGTAVGLSGECTLADLGNAALAVADLDPNAKEQDEANRRRKEVPCCCCCLRRASAVTHSRISAPPQTD